MRFFNCKCGDRIAVANKDEIICETCGRKYHRRLKEDEDSFDARWDREFPDNGADILSPEDAKVMLHRMAEFR